MTNHREDLCKSLLSYLSLLPVMAAYPRILAASLAYLVLF